MYSAVQFQVVENSFIHLMEDTLLTVSDTEKIELSIEGDELFISNILFWKCKHLKIKPLDFSPKKNKRIF